MASGYRRTTDSLPTCMNCGSVLYGPYCSQCGQEETAIVTWRGLWQRASRRTHRFEFAWPRTFARLTTDPGDTARRWLRGRRLPYVHPLVYALVATAMLAAAGLSGLIDLSADRTPWGPRPGSPSSPAVFVWGGVAGLLATLLLAVLQQALFRDEPFSRAETWIFDLYLFGQLALYQALFGLLGAYASMIGLAALGLVVLLVVAFGLGGFYRRPVPRVLPAALVLAAVYGSVVCVVAWGVRLVLDA